MSPSVEPQLGAVPADLVPEHPAARVVVDERGLFHQLGLSEAEIRLECVKVAERMLGRDCHHASHLTAWAGTLVDFVLSKVLVEPVDMKAGAPMTGRASSVPSAAAQEALQAMQGLQQGMQAAKSKAPERPALSGGAINTITEEIAEIERRLTILRPDLARAQEHAAARDIEVDRYLDRLSALRRSAKDLSGHPAP